MPFSSFLWLMEKLVENLKEENATCSFLRKLNRAIL